MAGLDRIVPDRPPIIEFGVIEIIDGVNYWPVGCDFVRISRKCLEELFGSDIQVRERLLFRSGMLMVDVVAYCPFDDFYVLEKWKV